MNLLDKFEAVEITVDTRISEDDRNFCAAHEAAYEMAKNSLQEFLFFWEDMLESQKNLPTVPDSKQTDYLPSKNVLDISPSAIKHHIETLHVCFIENLIRYFNHRYHVSASIYAIMNKLLPQEPDRHSASAEEISLYKSAFQTLSLTANQVVEEIFSQFDGRGLDEQAFYELKQNCHKVSWNIYQKKPLYERKKSVIRFLCTGCSYKDWRHDSCWELSDAMKNILLGISHYETRSLSVIPPEIGSLLKQVYIGSDLTEFTDCKKVKQFRLFKNGRADIRFADESLARCFEEEYLGTVC